MKITKCIHVTQTEKKHLKAFMDSKMTDAKIGRKRYSILSGMPYDNNSFLYKVRITTPKRNDYGEKVFGTQTIELIN